MDTEDEAFVDNLYRSIGLERQRSSGSDGYNGSEEGDDADGSETRSDGDEDEAEGGFKFEYDPSSDDYASDDTETVLDAIAEYESGFFGEVDSDSEYEGDLVKLYRRIGLEYKRGVTLTHHGIDHAPPPHCTPRAYDIRFLTNLVNKIPGLAKMVSLPKYATELMMTLDVLANMTHDDDEMRRTALDLSAVEVVADAVKEQLEIPGMSSPEVCAAAARALIALAHPWTEDPTTSFQRKNMVMDGATDAMLRAIKAHLERPDVVMDCLNTLMQVAGTREVVFKKVFARDAIPVAMEIAWRYCEQNSEVCDAGLRLAGALTRFGGLRSHEASALLLDNGALQTLHRALCFYKGRDAAILWGAQYVLFGIVKWDQGHGTPAWRACMERVVRSNILQPLMAASEEYRQLHKNKSGKATEPVDPTILKVADILENMILSEYLMRSKLISHRLRLAALAVLAVSILWVIWRRCWTQPAQA